MLSRLVHMPDELRRDLVIGLAVAAVALLVYANSLGNGFAWDDTNVIVTNPALQGPPLSVFSSIDIARDYDLIPYYRPLTYLTFLIEGRLYGLTPLPMHLFNILLHAANAFLIYRLARSLINDTNAALLAGLLFAVHPLHTEGVDFISGGRNTLLACFFVLMAYLLHQRSIIRQKIFIAVAGSLFFLAGLFSKEAAVMVLPFIIALEIGPLRGKTSGSRMRPVIRLLPYVAGTVCYFAMRWMILSGLGIQTSIIPGFGSGKLQSLYLIPSLGVRLLDNLYIIPRYLLPVVWPTALSPRYVVPDDLSLLALPLFAVWVCIIGILAWLLTRGRSRATIFGLSWLVAFWLPVSGIVWFPSASMADRFLYVPAIGLWIVVADQAVRLLPSGGTARRYGVIAATLVLLVLATFTVRRNLDWKSDITLFTQMVKQYPDNSYGHAGLGVAYFFERERDHRYLSLAEQELEKVLALNRIVPGVHTIMGNIRLERGDNEGALYYYTIALGIYPLDKEARLNRGITLENLGRQEEALGDFRLFLTAPGYELADARPYAEARVRELAR